LIARTIEIDHWEQYAAITLPTLMITTRRKNLPPGQGAACSSTPVLHDDNGVVLKSTGAGDAAMAGHCVPVLATRVSDDNAFVESLFHAAKRVWL